MSRVQQMIVDCEQCTSGVDLPEDGALYAFLTQLAALNGIIFVSICVFIGPINVAANLFTMVVLTRKELRSTYNFVFFLMALDQTIIIGTLSLYMFKCNVFVECKPWFFSHFWALFDLIMKEQVIAICKAHATWLAVIIALMRLLSIRSHGRLELQFNAVAVLCAAAMVFVIVVNAPNFLSYSIVWLRLDSFCDNKEFGDLLVPFALESPALYQNDCLLLRLNSLLAGVLHSALPCLLLIVLSLILLRYLRKVRNERVGTVLQKNTHECSSQDRTTILLILIMVTTMISEIPQGIISLLEGFLSLKMRTQVTPKISMLVISLMLLSSACNMFIHLFMSKKFREVAKRYLCFACRKVRKIVGK